MQLQGHLGQKEGFVRHPNFFEQKAESLACNISNSVGICPILWQDQHFLACSAELNGTSAGVEQTNRRASESVGNITFTAAYVALTVHAAHYHHNYSSLCHITARINLTTSTSGE